MSEKQEIEVNKTEILYKIYQHLNPEPVEKKKRHPSTISYGPGPFDRFNRSQMRDERFKKARYVVKEVKPIFSDEKTLSAINTVEKALSINFIFNMDARVVLEAFKTAVKPFKKLKAIKENAEKFDFSEEESCENLYKTTDINSVVKVDKVIEDLEITFKETLFSLADKACKGYDDYINERVEKSKKKKNQPLN